LIANSGGSLLDPKFDPNGKEKKVSYKLDGDSLSIDASEGYRSFVGTKTISDLDLDWGKLSLKRIKE